MLTIKITIMKRFATICIFSLAILCSSQISFCQDSKQSNIDFVKARIAEMNRTLDEEIYFSTYEIIEYTLPIVEDKKQINEIVSILKKLKKKCPQKPASICDYYDAKIKNCEKVDDEILFWNGCKDLIR